MGKLQGADHKTHVELGGTKSLLMDDDKLYVTANALNKTLKEAIEAGDIGGGGSGGGIDTFFVWDPGQSGDNVTVDGNNAIFDGVGALVGISAKTSTASKLISSTQSYEWQANGVDASGDFIGVTAELPQGFAGRDVTFKVDYRTVNMVDDDLEFTIKDDESGNILETVSLPAREDGGNKISSRAEITVFIPAESAGGAKTLKFGFHNRSAATTAQYLFGKIEASIFELKALENLAKPERHELDGPQTLTNGILTILDFDESIINGGQVTTGASWKFTAKIPGVYSVGASARWGATAVQYDSNLALHKNGVEFSLLTNNSAKQKDATNAGIIQNGITLITLAVGDFVDVRAQHNSGADLDVLDNKSTYIDIHMVKSEETIVSTPSNAARPSRYSSSVIPAIASGVTKIIDYSAKEFDNQGLVTVGAAWKWTAPNSGIFYAGAVLIMNTQTYTINTDMELSIFKNGSVYAKLAAMRTDTAGGFTPSFEGDCLVDCVKGDTIDFRFFQNSGTSRTPVADANYNHCNIFQIDRNPIATFSQPVIVFASNTTADLLTSGVFTELQYDGSTSKDIDTHNAWNGSEFTAPRDMIVEIKAAIQFQSAAWPAGTFAEVVVDVNQNGDSLGATYLIMHRHVSDGTAFSMSVSGSVIFRVVEGDVLRIKGRQTSGSGRNRETSGDLNWVSFHEISQP